MGRKSNISNKINNLEKKKKDAGIIKTRINSMSSLFSDVIDDLNESNKNFKGNSSDGSDWGYTDNNGIDSIDRGKIDKLIDKINGVNGDIFSLSGKITDLIAEYDEKISALKIEYNSLE